MGKFLIAVGAFGALLSFFVPTAIDDTHNLGLLQLQMMALHASLGFAILGGLLYIADLMLINGDEALRHQGSTDNSAFGVVTLLAASLILAFIAYQSWPEGKPDFAASSSPLFSAPGDDDLTKPVSPDAEAIKQAEAALDGTAPSSVATPRPSRDEEWFSSPEDAKAVAEAEAQLDAAADALDNAGGTVEE